MAGSNTNHTARIGYPAAVAAQSRALQTVAANIAMLINSRTAR